MPQARIDELHHKKRPVNASQVQTSGSPRILSRSLAITHVPKLLCGEFFPSKQESR